MSKTFYVSYKIYGTVSVEANDEQEAVDKVQGTTVITDVAYTPVPVGDEALLAGISRYDNQIDGDAIEVYDVQEVDE